jgi:ABC-type sugar transport system substrate-binding protein
MSRTKHDPSTKGVLVQTTDDRRGPLRRLAVVALVAMTVVSLPACGSSKKNDATAAAATTTTAAAKTKKKVKIAMEQVLTNIQFAKDTLQGMQGFASEDGSVDLQVQGPPTIDPVLAQKQATDLLSQQPDGFGVSPFPPEVWQRTLKTIKDRVPNSIAFNIKQSGLPGDAAGAPQQTFVGVDDKASARSVATSAIKIGGLGPNTTGYAILAQCVASKTGVLADRTAGFTEVVKAKLPKVKIINFDSKVEPQANTNAWQAELQANPKPVLTLGTCDQDGTSIYKLKKTSGAKFVSGAVETPPEVIKGIQEGIIQASSAVNWYLQGYTATRLLTEAARGERKMPAGFVDVGFTLITKDNIADIAKRNSSLANIKAWNAPKIQALFAALPAATHPLTDAWK